MENLAEAKVEALVRELVSILGNSTHSPLSSTSTQLDKLDRGLVVLLSLTTRELVTNAVSVDWSVNFWLVVFLQK